MVSNQGERGDHGFPGERGPKGDHGQDGRAGSNGIDGRAGRDAEFYEDPAINQAIAEALGEKKVRGTDNRFLVGFLLLVLFVGLFGFYDDYRDTQTDKRFRSAVIAVCEKTNTDNRRVNAILDQLARSAMSAPGLTQEQREERADRYTSLHLSISTCPP